MGQQDVKLTTENAMLAIAKAADVSQYEGWFSTVHFFTGIDNELKKGPCVIVACLDASEELPGSNLGVWNVKAGILVKEQASKTDRHETTLAQTIFAQFMTGSIEQDLVNATGSYVVHKVWAENMPSSVEGKFWVEQLNLNVMCGITA